MQGTYTLKELARLLDGECHGDGDVILNHLAALDEADCGSVSFIDNAHHLGQLSQTKATAVILSASFLNKCQTNAIVVSNPYLALNQCVELFAASDEECPHIHSSAVVECDINDTLMVAANSVISQQVRIGKNVTIGANVSIANQVIIDDGVTIGSNVTINSNTRIGQNTFIDSGCTIGTRPFNPIKEKGVWLSGPSLGGVVIADNVCVGANCTIDRGSLAKTRIGCGVKIDNLVQIAHDVIIGEHSIIAGCATIGAHTEIGQHCIIGGGSCIAGYLSISDGIVITGMSAVTKSLTKEGVYTSGTNVSQHQVWRKNAARFKRLDQYIKRLKNLEDNLR